MGSLDLRYGGPRGPHEINDWEQGREPLSLATLNGELGQTLLSYRTICQAPLLRKAAQCFTLIWAMDESGEIRIAYEELTTEALEHEGTIASFKGYPRRRGATTHPVEFKKLGHPTLLKSGDARVAGELFLDFVDGSLFWFVNCSSGRYCRKIAPSKAQQKAVHELFMDLIDNEVRYDDVDG